MSTALHLAGPKDMAILSALVAACHNEAGLDVDDTQTTGALAPLLEGCPYGAIYLLGPARAPVGYVVITFGWSVAAGGMDATIDEIFIRPAVRRRGMASDVLIALPDALADAGVKVMHLSVDPDAAATKRLFTRAGFTPRDQISVMSRPL